MKSVIFMEGVMKQTVWNITLAPLITLAACIALMTTAAFSFFLLYMSKIRYSFGKKV